MALDTGWAISEQRFGGRKEAVSRKGARRTRLMALAAKPDEVVNSSGLNN